jgi:L-threonylcarbamoyladenylate synthase
VPEIANIETLLTDNPETAAKFIRSGGLVAFPTETVFGLGANIFDEKAVAKIFEAKMRPADNPLIAHISNTSQIDQLVSLMTDSARKLIKRFFPGPLTIVLPKSDRVPLIATAGLDSIGIRMPRHPLAQRFLKACGTPVAAPSANLSGRPSPTSWLAVRDDLNGRIDCILKGGPTEIGLESTVVDCRTEIPLVLRKGAISVEELRGVVPETCFTGTDDNQMVRSPGMKYSHYSPLAKVCVGMREGTPTRGRRTAFIGLSKPEKEFEYVFVATSPEEYARSLFEFFRECDRRRIETIYCEPVEELGIGAALMDRLRRAAGD